MSDKDQSDILKQIKEQQEKQQDETRHINKETWDYSDIHESYQPEKSELDDSKPPKKD